MLGQNLIDAIYEIKSSKSVEETETQDQPQYRNTLGEETRDENSHDNLMAAVMTSAHKPFESQQIYQDQVDSIRSQQKFENRKSKKNNERRTSSARLSGSRSTKISPSGEGGYSRVHTKSFGTKITSLGLDGTIISDYVGRVSDNQNEQQ